MGKKKKSSTTTYETTTTKTVVVKLSYLQTLAISEGLAYTQQLETASSVGPGSASSKDKQESPLPDLLDPFDVLAPFGSKKKTSVSTEEENTGQKIKDQWLQPEFDRIRYTIGIRELTASSYQFAEQSEFISVPFLSPKEIVKVNVIVDEYIPPQFDQNQQWIDYYIKPEGLDEWIRINPLNSPTKFNIEGEIIPKIISFNLPKPTTAQLEDKYQTTESPVKQMRFRAVIKRPSGGNFDSMTPLVKSYRLVMTPRS